MLIFLSCPQSPIHSQFLVLGVHIDSRMSRAVLIIWRTELEERLILSIRGFLARYLLLTRASIHEYLLQLALLESEFPTGS